MNRFTHTPNRLVTTIHQGDQIWLSRSVAVVGIVLVEFEGKTYVLIGKRGEGAADFKGYWNLPCGYLDWDESAIDACRREIFEETGIFIDDETDTWRYEDQPAWVKSNPKNNRQNVSLYFIFKRKIENPNKFLELVESFSTENSEKDEVANLAFVETSRIDNYEFCFGHDEMIKKFT